MSAKKSKAAKKKRISKHVLQAKEEQERLQKEQAGGTPTATPGDANSTTSSTKKKKKTRKVHIKDPSVAAGYLSSWKQHKADPANCPWKFSKNTQSWLIRHMYETDKVAKGPFTILLDYLQGLQEGSHTRKRIRSEATRRALRYKDYEKSKASQSGADENDKKQNNDGNDDSNNVTGTSKGTEETEGTLTKEEQEDDELRWKKLSDHDKRTEYKRSRKVLEAISE